jgi:UDP-glucose/GDP-mannose dehydrogenase family, NAD binding domain
MIDSAVDVIAAALRPGGMVILESTTYPGTTEDRVSPRLAEGTGLRAPEDYHLIFSPERIDPGNPVYSLQNPPGRRRPARQRVTPPPRSTRPSSTRCTACPGHARPRWPSF